MHLLLLNRHTRLEEIWLVPTRRLVVCRHSIDAILIGCRRYLVIILGCVLSVKKVEMGMWCNAF